MKKSKKVDESERSYAAPLMEYKKKPTDLKVEIRALEARNLAKTEFFGKSDPYMCIYINNEVQPRVRTKVIKSTQNPRWNETLEVWVDDFIQNKRNMNIRCEIYNYEKSKAHDFLGQISVNFKDYEELKKGTGAWKELFPPLEKRTSKDKVSGELHIGIRCIASQPQADTYGEDNAKIRKGLQEVKRSGEEDGAKKDEDEEPHIDPMKCTLDSDNLRDGIKIGKEITFRINPYSQHGKPCATNPQSDEWKAELMSPDGKTVTPMHTMVNPDGTISCSFKPTKAGQNKIMISVNGKQIRLSPYPVNIMAPTYGPKCVAYGGCLEPKGEKVVNKPMLFHVRANDEEGNPIAEGGDQVVAQVTGPHSVETDVEDNEDGTYTVRFNVKEPGTYQIATKVNDHTINDSPHEIIVDDETDAKKSEVQGLTSVVRVDTPIHLRIQAMDCSGNLRERGGDPFKLEVKNPSGEILEENSFLRDNDDGTYDATFFVNETGEHQLSIRLKNAIVKNAKLNAKPRVSPEMCTVSGPGLSGGDIVTGQGIPISLTIHARDSSGDQMKEGGDKFQIDLQKLDEPELTEECIPSIVDNNNGTYHCSFQPSLPGLYKVKIRTEDGNEIAPSPLEIPVTEGVDASQCEAFGPGIQKAYVDLPTQFTIQSKDEKERINKLGGLSFDVDITDPKGEKSMGAKVEKMYYKGNGQYPVKYTPVQKGLHALKVSHMSKPIKNSPFIVNVLDNLEAPDPEKCVVKNVPSKAVIGKPILMSVRLVNKAGKPIKCGGDLVTVSVKNDDNATMSPTIQEVIDNGNGTYSIHVVPRSCGNHSVDIKVLETSLPLCPFKIEAVADPFGTGSSVPRITIHSFIVQCYDVSNRPILDDDMINTSVDNLKVKFFESNGTPTKHICHNVKYTGAGKFKVSFLATSKGSYKMTPFFNGEAITSIDFKFAS